MSEINIVEATSSNNYMEVETSEYVLIDPYNYIKDKISEFTSLENDWDGYGGIPLIDEIGETTLKLITVLNSSFIDLITDIFPNPHGTVTIEWENKSEEKLSLEIGRNNYSYFVSYLNKEPKLVNGENIILDIKEFAESLGELFSEELYIVVF